MCPELTFLWKCAEIWLLLYGLCFLACCLWYLGQWELPQGSQWMFLSEGTMLLHGLLTTLSTSMEAQRFNSSWINTRVYYNQINLFFCYPPFIAFQHSFLAFYFLFFFIKTWYIVLTVGGLTLRRYWFPIKRLILIWPFQYANEVGSWRFSWNSNCFLCKRFSSHRD